MKRILQNFDAFVSAILLVIMTSIAFVNVISRYIFHESLSFTDEITTSLFVFLSLFGASIAVKRGSHLGLNVLTDMLPVKVRKYVSFAGYILGAGFCGIVAYYSFFMVSHEYSMGQTSPAMRVPEWIYGSSVPIGLAAICYRFIERAIKTITQKEEL